MAEDSRISSLQEFLHRYLNGDRAGALAMLHEEVRFRIPGRTFLSGDMSGRENVSRHLQAFTQFTDGSAEVLKWEDWLAGLKYVAAVTTTQMQHVGAVSAIRVVFVAAFSDDGLITDFEVFFSDDRALQRFTAGWTP